MTKLTMKLSQCLIYLLFVVFTETTLCYPRERSTSSNLTISENIKATPLPHSLTMKDSVQQEDGTLFLNIDGDSNSEDELAEKVFAALDLTNDVLERSAPKVSEESNSARRRRTIFGKDDRVNMRTSREAQMYPFSTAVMLSSGCTGTLIGSQHVLTAAHCVHNGKRTLKSAKLLKIGLLQRSGKFHWIRASRIYVPKEWKKQSSLTSKAKLKYDFAVLYLKRRHNRQSMSVQTSSLLPGSKIQFAGFHGDKWYNSLWYSYCRVFRKSHDMIINFCDGVKGVSGSGVYVDTSSGSRNVVVGVVAATSQATLKGKVLKFNVVNSLTSTKVRQIRKWVSRR